MDELIKIDNEYLKASIRARKAKHAFMIAEAIANAIGEIKKQEEMEESKK